MSPEYLQQIVNKPSVEKVIVTGGTKGIGDAIVRDLAGQMHNVALCARNIDGLNTINLKGNVLAYQIDLGEKAGIRDFVRQSSEAMGGINVLILNAAVSGITESDEYTHQVNFDAQCELVKSAADMLRESGGRVVFLTSQQAEHPVEGNLAYGNSKREVEQWLKEFSAEEGNEGVQVFCVNPGPVATAMHEDALMNGSDEIQKRSRQIKEEGKLRDPNVVGHIISKMSVSGMKFNPETCQYDIPIANNEIVVISDENIEFEECPATSL